MAIQSHTLYKITHNSAIYRWTITTTTDSVVMDYGILGGAVQTKEEKIFVNQSGRSLNEQIVLRMQSRINRRLDQGYRRTIEEAKANIGSNAMNLARPMLAQKLRDVKNIDYNRCFFQKKYNGHRCLVTNTGDGLIAYSRSGKPIITVDHILAGLNIEEGETLDGELYIHNTLLQDLGSLIRRKQENSSLLKYVVYDTLSNDPYEQRIETLNGMSLGQHASVAPTELWTPKTIIKEELAQSIADGYEGLMLRHGTKGYEIGKRSQSLVKVKQCLDQEFLVVNVEPSKDGWGILMCMVDADRYFKVPAPGTMEDKHEIYKNRNNYIGKYITVEFFEWTKDGIPFHPKATNWREAE